jgi:hypothetical protein
MPAGARLLSNRLLLALPPADVEALAPDLELRPCPRELMLADADSELDEFFFPARPPSVIYLTDGRQFTCP